VNIPAQNDSTFTFNLTLKWRPSNTTVTIKTYKNIVTNGWVQAIGTQVAPSGTTSAFVQLVVKSQNGSIYVDDCAFST
jgi:hypothetical protein